MEEVGEEAGGRGTQKRGVDGGGGGYGERGDFEGKKWREVWAGKGRSKRKGGREGCLECPTKQSSPTGCSDDCHAVVHRPPSSRVRRRVVAAGGCPPGEAAQVRGVQGGHRQLAREHDDVDDPIVQAAAHRARHVIACM